MLALPMHYRLILPLAVLALPTVACAADLAFKPTALAFASTALTEARALKATLKNTSAQGITVTGVAIGGANAADYTQKNTCPAPLPAGQSCVFTVTFKPLALAASAASLTLSTDNPALPSLSLPLSGNPYPGVLNDTGITQCSDATRNGLACPLTAFPRQDAEYGRDKTAAKDLNGHAGFNFTKLSTKGRPLSVTATSWSCVRDNVTGLVWEAKPVGDGLAGNQGLHDADDTYTWYSTNSANNNGSAGYQNQGQDCFNYSGAAPDSFCNTEAYVKRVNTEVLCGAKDWRLPTRKELYSLVDLSVPYPPGPAIDAKYFPDTAEGLYWTATSRADQSNATWTVNFSLGESLENSRSTPRAVRLVRGGQ
jgi:hypothetical protein